MKTETTYSLGHDDVVELVREYFKREHNIDVKPEELHFNLQEYRYNEGYYSGGDQPAKIKQIWFKR